LTILRQLTFRWRVRLTVRLLVERIILIIIRLVVERIRLTVMVVGRIRLIIRLVVTKVIEQLGIDLTKVIERIVFMGRNFIDTMVIHTELGRMNSSLVIQQQVAII